MKNRINFCIFSYVQFQFQTAIRRSSPSLSAAICVYFLVCHNHDFSKKQTHTYVRTPWLASEQRRERTKERLCYFERDGPQLTAAITNNPRTMPPVLKHIVQYVREQKLWMKTNTHKQFDELRMGGSSWHRNNLHAQPLTHIQTHSHIHTLTLVHPPNKFSCFCQDQVLKFLHLSHFDS